MLKKLFKILLFILISLSLIAFAPKVFKENITPFLLNKETSSAATYTINTYEDYRTAIINSIKNYEPNINLIFKGEYENKTNKEILSAANQLIKTLGPGNYIRKYSITQKKSNIYEFYTITYNYEKNIDEIKKQSKQVDSIVKNVINEIISPSMSDFEKEKAIHDYIVNTTRYDNENFNNQTTPIESHTAYGVFVNKVAVCEGYAIAMKKLLDEVNIESLLVIGTAKDSDHSWNLVKLDNEWYHVDPTWDDPVYIVNGEVKDILSYKYFNLTDEEMSENHTWDKNHYPKANGNKYNKLKLQD